MGIFESIGRTNTLSESVDKLSTMVMDLRKSKAEEETQASNRRVQAQQIETNELENKSLAFQLRERAEREKTRNAPIDVTMHPSYLSLPQEAQANIMQMLQRSGVVDERGIGKGGDIFDFMGSMAKDATLFESGMGPVVAGKKQALVDIRKRIFESEQTATAKGKDLTADKMHQALKVREQQAYEDYMASSGNYETHLADLRKNEEARAQIKLKAREERGTTAAGIKPTAMQRNWAALKERFPFASDADIGEYLSGAKGLIPESKAVDARESAKKWALDNGYTQEQAEAFGEKNAEDTLGFIRATNAQRGLRKGAEAKIPAGFKLTDKTKNGKPVYYNNEANIYWVPE